MGLPFDCDALLPIAERYSSMKFRRVARHIRAAHLDHGSARELAAFLAIVPPQNARWIFRGKEVWVREAKLVLDHFYDQRLVDANLECVDVDVGKAVLSAMRDGGWRQGPLPMIVRDTIAEMRHSGLTVEAVGAELGLTVDQVRGPRATVSRVTDGLWKVTG